MQKPTQIYAGFAEGLDALNRTTASGMMLSTPGGRAYKKGRKIYLDSVHIACVGEEDIYHARLAETFRRSARRYAGKVYMGAAGLLNLSFIAASRAAAAILYDINAAQTVFWNDAIAALAENPQVEDFVKFLEREQERLPQKLRDAFNGYAVSGTLAHFGLLTDITPDNIYRSPSDIAVWASKGRESMADRLWLRRGYTHLHLLAKAGALGAVTLDVLDKKACKQLKDYLDQVVYWPTPVLCDSGGISTKATGDAAARIRFRKDPSTVQQGARVGVLYISNILSYIDIEEENQTDWTGRALRKPTADKARKNLSPLLDPNEAHIIDHSPGLDCRNWPTYAQKK